MTVYSGTRDFSCSAEATVYTNDDNYEFHFSISGSGEDYWEDEVYDKKTTNYHLLIDSHLPFYIKRFDIPAYTMIDGVRHDTTLTCYAVRPYLYRSGGLPIGSGNYRLRLHVDGHYRSNIPDIVYGPSRDCDIKFDGEIINPCNSSHKSQWTSDDGFYLNLYGWEQDGEELVVSDEDSYMTLWWHDDAKLSQYLAASPYNVYDKNDWYYFPLDLGIGETVHGEAPRVEGAFGVVGWDNKYGYTRSSAGINFGNNPLFSGTYNEYRTYIEQTYGG